KVTKDWKLLTAEKPVDKIEVELYKDGVATGKKLELTKDNNWSGEFKNLEVANGLGNINYHKYTVKEVGEIDKAIKLDGKVFIVSYEGDMKTGFKIINKEKPPV
ncbi:Cna B-type domain-containing protein, partial [Helcococcus ovis]